jgi:DNA invertase Pin-like site-specific DNA recombinase
VAERTLKIKFTAIYCRVSSADNDIESNSIVNQKAILYQYADIQGYTNCKTYVDDGISGTTFGRDGFNEMIEDVKLHNIDCIVVKDAYVKLRITFLEKFYEYKKIPLK